MERNTLPDPKKYAGRFLHIALCDNNIDWLSTEEKYLNMIDGIRFEYNSFESGEELINAYRNAGCSYDIIFLDMEMKPINGIETANIIREIDRNVIIIFITNYEKYVMQSFECMPFRFLLKPVGFDEFKNVMLRAVNLIEDYKAALVFTENRSTVRVLCEDILYLQSKDQSVHIITREREYKTYQHMSELVRMLNASYFVPVYKGIIVNVQHISSVGSNEIELRECGIRLPLSRNYKRSLKECVLRYSERKFGL